MKRLFLFCVLFCAGLAAYSQSSEVADSKPKYRSKHTPVFQSWKENNVFQHLDASITMGTTGIGIDIASPVGDYVQLRTGFAFMPPIHYNMTFGVQVGETKDDSKFNTLANVLEDFTGYKVDSKVDMIGEPTYNNFKFMVDVFPFKNNKHWHLTAGFYWGNSKIGKAYNTTEDMPSLVAVGIYNKMYEKAMNREPFATIEYNGNKFRLTDDPEYQDILQEKFSSYGRMGVRIGDYKSDGSPYILEPDENSMVKAEVRVNSFKPYLGIGYGGRLIKGNEKYKVSIDCGAMFWGGTPSILTHDGTDLAKEVRNIDGKVGTYVDLIKTFKVFPVVNVRFTKTLF